MSSLKPIDALNALRRTNAILNDLLRDMTQEQAIAARDGADGWNVVEIVCHLRDLETVYRRRIEQMLESDNPNVLSVDIQALVVQNNYAAQNLRAVLGDLNRLRADFVAWLQTLAPDQWERRGVHPEYGPYNVLEATIRQSLHDVNHIEQILKALGRR